MDDTIEKRQTKNKEMLLEHLKRIPNIQIVCEKIGIGRATYYRWRRESKEFAKKADESIDEGNGLMNDMTEGQLISLIRDKHPTAIFYWLNHRHPAYTNKLEITTSVPNELTEDQIDELIQLLYDKNTFRQGQTLLTGYVFRKKISERMAQLILKVFMSQMKTEDILTRKAEAEVMTEVMTRKAQYKEKKKFKYGPK